MILSLLTGIQNPRSNEVHVLVCFILVRKAVYPGDTLYLQCMLSCSIAQSCQTLCDLMDYSPPGSSVHGMLQARILEWVAIPFPKGSSRLRDSAAPTLAGRFFTSEPPRKPYICRPGVNGILTISQQLCWREQRKSSLLEPLKLKNKKTFWFHEAVKSSYRKIQNYAVTYSHGVISGN